MATPRLSRPLDDAALERLALRYVERYATTRAKLARYLTRKVKERGWAGGDGMPDTAILADRLATLGYVNDRGFAESRAEAMARRGLGARRIAGAFHADGIDADDAAALVPDIAARAEQSALVFARRKRIGPYATQIPDRADREKALAAMLRAGHPFDLARMIVQLDPGQPPPFDDEGHVREL